MMRDEVCQEFRSCRSWCNKDGKVTCVDLACRGRLPDTEAMADEIVRLRRILDALREPSGRVVRRMTQRTIEGLHHVDLDIVLDAIRVALPAAVEAAEQEATREVG